MLGLVVVFFLQPVVAEVNKFLIPFAAGDFIYIAGSDLIPEVHKEVKIKNSLISLLFFILGILVMLALLNIG